ncbi:MAG: response regulator transcription factor [Peptostreptococcaceae bacterium]
MYSVYLLDDEPFILEGLKYIVPWDEYGFEIVGCASNGEDGLQEILNKNIDLIITDIMMPKMTGLELMENLNQHNYDTNVIVLSAFQEFDYAKKAIHMGAENYLLKPIDTDELSDNLKKVYKKLKEKEKLYFNNNIARNNSLVEVIREKNIKTEEELITLGINIKNEKYCVAILELENSQKDIKSILGDAIDGEEIIYGIESKSKALLIIDEQEHSVIIDKLTILKNKLIEMSEGIIYISLGKCINSINELYISYDTAKSVSEYKIVYPNISWIKEYKDPCENKNIHHMEFEELKKVLMDKDFSNTSLCVSKMFKTIKENESLTPMQIKIKAIEVFLSVYNHFNETKLIKGMHAYLENAINKSTVDEIELEVINMIKYMQSKLEQAENSISPVILKLLQYIEEGYKDDLNLKEISDNLNINSIYLGQLFQKETGVLFSDYINNFRINKSKDLLINTSLKASEIGELVGYANKNYFYRKFKDIVGITPSEWRKLNI